MRNENENILTLFRLQSPDENAEICLNKNLPVRRVIINNCGKIVFNPDSRQFIYFSRGENHHIYYIFKKMLRIITDNINKYKGAVNYLNTKVYRPSDFYNNMSLSLLKEIRDFFNDFVPEQNVELVMVNYLEAFSRFFEQCAKSNKKKSNLDLSPEITDTRMFGGAYGVNRSWLELLKNVTVDTSVTKLSMNRFLDIMVDSGRMFGGFRKNLRSFINTNPDYAAFLDRLIFARVPNPDFQNKNAANNIVKWVDDIYNSELYNKDAKLSRHDFYKAKRELKAELEQER